MIENVDFEELRGASIAEKRRAIDLACRRYKWWRDRTYINKSFSVFGAAVLASCTLLYLLDNTLWLVPVVLLMSVVGNHLLLGSQAERIRPLLPKALEDVRQHHHM